MMEESLKEKTGKSLEEWKKILSKKTFEKHKEIIDFLKSEYGLTYGYANTIAHKFRGSDAGSVENTDDLVTQQYTGKEELLPIYEKLLAQIKVLGSDVTIAPKKAYVSIIRKKQFALIQPSTKARLDLGINLKGKTPQGRLEASGSFNSMVSHRVKLANANEVDKETADWLREAYEAAG